MDPRRDPMDGEPGGWFERLYAAAERGDASIPWERAGPNPVLEQWARERGLSGDGRRAVVVGCGLGDDAEHFASLGFETLGFDLSATAIKLARRRFPDSRVEYAVADVLDRPAEWSRRFDLVVESLTAQSVPDPPRREVIAAIADLLAPGGTLVVNAALQPGEEQATGGPPWPLTRREVESFAGDGVRATRIATVAGPDGSPRWLSEFTR